MFSIASNPISVFDYELGAHSSSLIINKLKVRINL